MGKIEIKQDGKYRIQLTDLFGGTRNDPGNIYRMIVRKAAPDFAIVAWGLHFTLRNGDRNALSKPLTLRAGSTVPMEVIVVRRDGFDGEINLSLNNLPPGVTATGLKIPSGKSKGILLVTANETAPRGFSQAKFTGKAMINDQEVVRTGFTASMAWPVANAWSEIPAPRLVSDIPISVCDSEKAAMTLKAAEDKVWEVVEGSKLTIPLSQTRRYDFSGANISLKTFGPGFEAQPAFNASLKDDQSQVVFDLAKLKTKPGDYEVAFYGKAVAKYRYHVEAVAAAELTLKQRQDEAKRLDDEAKNLTAAAKTAPAEQKAAVEKQAQSAVAKSKAAKLRVQQADNVLKAAKRAANPKDTVDIVVSSPIKIRVKPVAKQEAKKQEAKKQKAKK